MSIKNLYNSGETFSIPRYIILYTPVKYKKYNSHT